MRTSIRLIHLALVLSAGLLSLPAIKAGELDPAAMLSASCEGCHGTDGRSPGSIPTIAGKSEEYLREALMRFRSGEGEATVMDRHAKGYSEEQIRRVAEYFSRKE